VLISNAWAQAAPAAGGDPTSGLMGMLPIILMFVVLWFLMIRPQMKRAKEHKAMVEAMQKGDEVLTNGGIAGRITKVGETYIAVEIADNVEISLQKAAVTAILPKGTLKTL
jgi:preprotein translocase subunit YajC